MKKQITLLLLLLLFTNCKNDELEKSEQSLWLNGYALSTNGDKVSDVIRFLFFPADNGEEYITSNNKLNTSSYYEYTHIDEDPIYARLIDERKIQRKDGAVISPVGDFTDLNKLTSSQLEVTLPIGKYFVVAFCSERGTNRDYWNKYATRYYNLESRSSPQALTVVIPPDFTQCGNIPWLNWQDKPYDF